MKRISLFILRARMFFDMLKPTLWLFLPILLFFQKHCIPLQKQVLERPLRKGPNHRAFSLTGRCSTSLSGCVLPEVMVLELIQWNICKTIFINTCIWFTFPPNCPSTLSSNWAASRKQPGPSQKSWGFRKRPSGHVFESWRSSCRHLPSPVFPSGKRVAHHWGPLLLNHNPETPNKP